MMDFFFLYGMCAHVCWMGCEFGSGKLRGKEDSAFVTFLAAEIISRGSSVDEQLILGLETAGPSWQGKPGEWSDLGCDGRYFQVRFHLYGQAIEI